MSAGQIKSFETTRKILEALGADKQKVVRLSMTLEIGKPPTIISVQYLTDEHGKALADVFKSIEWTPKEVV